MTIETPKRLLRSYLVDVRVLLKERIRTHLWFAPKCLILWNRLGWYSVRRKPDDPFFIMIPEEMLRQTFDEINERIEKIHYPIVYKDVGFGSIGDVPNCDFDWDEMAQRLKTAKNGWWRTKDYKDKRAAVYELVAYLVKEFKAPVKEVFWRVVPEISECFDFDLNTKLYTGYVRFSTF